MLGRGGSFLRSFLYIVAPLCLAYSCVSAETPNLGGLLVHIVKPTSHQMILPETFPLPGTKATSVSLFACGGEYEPVSFVMRALGGKVPNITIVSSDLINTASKAKILAENVDVTIVKPWFQAKYSWYEIGKTAPSDFRQTLVPELLLKDDGLVLVDTATEKNQVKVTKNGKSQYVFVNPKVLAASEQVMPSITNFPVTDAKAIQPFALSPNTNKQIWATVYVPTTTAPGTYTGQLLVQSDRTPIGVIDVNLNVLPFTLAPPKITYNIYYRGKLDPIKASIGSEFKNQTQMLAELNDLKKHGISNPSFYQPSYNAAMAREALNLRKQVGMTGGGPLYNLGLPMQETIPNLTRIVPQVISWAKEYGFDGAYLYGVDEAKGAALTAQRERWDLIRGMGGKLMAAGYTGTIDYVGNKLDLFVHAHKPSAAEADRWHAIGRKISNYANPQSGPESPFLFRLNYGLVLWANNYDGAMPYAYQHCFGSCWSDIDHKTYRDHNLTYPTADGVIDTIAWEGFREGIDDVRYITTLERLIATSKKPTNAVVVEAKEFLNALRKSSQDKQKSAGKYNLNMSVDLDSIRSDIVKRILAVLGT
jgi:hypothetical protein